MQPLTNILLKIFARGFYTAHAGLLAVGFFVMFGMVEPGQIVNYHKTLMLTMVSSPLMLAVVFAAWFIYAAKCWHYVTGQIGAINQQFLFYSSNAFDRKQQFKSWFYIQSVLMLPISVYGLIAAGVGLAHHYYILSLALLVYLALLTAISARLYIRTINKLIDGGAQSWFFTLSSKWNKPWFSLFIYNIFDKLIEICERMGFKPDITHEANNVHSILQLVEAGLGVSILPVSLQQQYAYLQVSFIPLNDIPVNTEVVLAYKSSNKSAALKWFIENYDGKVQQA